MKWIIPMMLLVLGSRGVATADLISASSDIKGAVADVGQHTQEVFKQMGIQQSKKSATSPLNQETLTGQKGDMEIHVQIKQTANNQSHVEVTARSS